MYYPCSENKDADQLRGYREADLRLCFRPCKLLVFSRTGSNGSCCCILKCILLCHQLFSISLSSILSTLGLGEIPTEPGGPCGADQTILRQTGYAQPTG